MSTADTSNSSRRALSWVVMLLGVALIGAAALVLLTMNGDDVAVPPVDPVPPTTDDDEPSDALDPLEEAPIGITYEILLTRDPFEPVRPPEQVVDSDEDDGNDDDTNGEEADNDANGDEDGDDNGEDNGEVPPSTTPADLPIIVFEVGDDSAVIQVGDLVLDVEVGASFANRYTLLAIVDGCARIRDDITGQQRTICPTQESFK